MSHSHVTREERVVITYLNMMNVSHAEITRRIGHHRGTVGRELRRNLDFFGYYHYQSAHDRASECRTACATRPVTEDAELMAYVEAKLMIRWSPEQIAGRLKVTPPMTVLGLSDDSTTVLDIRKFLSSPFRKLPLLRAARMSARLR